jgi:serine/threonine protein kinase
MVETGDSRSKVYENGDQGTELKRDYRSSEIDDMLMPFSFVPAGEIPDEEFDELAEHVFDTVRNYEGPVRRNQVWPVVVENFRSPNEFRSAREDACARFAIQMELNPLWNLLRILFPHDAIGGDIAPTSGIVFYAPRTGTNWTLKSDWLRLKFDYDYQKPLNLTILQEGGYNSKVFQINRDLFPEFFEQMSSIPAESDTVILKVYDEFQLQNHRYELSLEFESPEEFLLSQLRERYIPEAAALKYIEYHNSSNPSNKINAPRIFDCGQLQMILDDSNNYVWRILASGCFLLEEEVPDCGDAAFTQLSLATGLEQIEMLSRLGIRHLDIKRSNTRVQSDGTIFLIDYSHVKLYEPQNLEECRRSFESMKKSFLWMMEDLGFETTPIAEFEASEDEPVSPYRPVEEGVC